MDLGYLAIYLAQAVLDGKITETSTSFAAGRLAEVRISNREVLLGEPIVFNAENIDDFNF